MPISLYTSNPNRLSCASFIGNNANQPIYL
uniref:Uncharacterized protein n=1 Tax=Arundo donax TaxID=35708 RepID=A0A0A9AEL7_ARUDO